MRKGYINRGQCIGPEELSVRGQAVCDAISMESVNGTVWNYSTCFSAILVLSGQNLNTYRDVISDLCRGTPSEGDCAGTRRQAKIYPEIR
jgi:hypothetical protein